MCDYLQSAFDLFKSILKNVFSILQWGFHHIHFLTVNFNPQHIKDLIAQLHITFVIRQRHHLIHTKGHHLQRLFLQHNNLPIQYTRISLYIAPQQINNLLIHMTIIDRIPREQLNLITIIVCLDTLTIIFRLDKVGMSLILEVVDVFLTSEHGTDGVEDSDLVVEGDVGVGEFPTCLEEAVGEIEVVIGVLVVCVEHRLQLNTQLQVLQYNPHNPLNLLRIALLKQLPKHLTIVAIRQCQLIKHNIQLHHRQLRPLFTEVTSNIKHT